MSLDLGRREDLVGDTRELSVSRTRTAGGKAPSHLLEQRQRGDELERIDSGPHQPLQTDASLDPFGNDRRNLQQSLAEHRMLEEVGCLFHAVDFVSQRCRR